MPGTFSQIYIHCIFAVKNRAPYLKKEFREEVFKYISGIITNKGHKAIIVNGMYDHIHLLIGLKPSNSLSELIRDVKNNSSNFINKNNWLTQKFKWQEGYGAFSCSHSQLGAVYDYILNQEMHHQKRSFKEENNELMNKNDIEYELKYLFD